MNKLLITLIILSLNFSIFAEEVKNVVAGDVVPFTGTLLSPTKAQELFQVAKERDALLLTNTSLQTTTALLNQDKALLVQEVKDYKLDNINLYKATVADKNASNLERVFWFLAGSVVILAGSYAVKNVR